jgi:acetylornithine/succinyldiaminopimelate/putrescine aminotransferase
VRKCLRLFALVASRAFLLGTYEDDRPTFESQAAYFEKHGLLLGGGLRCVSLRSKAGASSYNSSIFEEALQSRGILADDTHEHVIRIAPPLVITADQVDWALEEIGAALTQDFS